MNNLKSIRELQKVLEHTKGLIDTLTPKVDIAQIDYVPQFELGTRYVNYELPGSQWCFKYIRVDAGVVGTDVKTGEELRNIYYRWI